MILAKFYFFILKNVECISLDVILHKLVYRFALNVIKTLTPLSTGYLNSNY